MTSGVYCITNKVNGKQYVGSSVNIAARWRDHRYKIGSAALYAAFTKHGIANFDFRVLEECAPEVMREHEQRWISALNPAYNIRKVVDGYWKHSEETKEKQRRASTGIRFTEERKRKISESGKRRVFTEEQKAAMSHKGVKHGPMSEERKARISAAKKEAFRVRAKSH